MDVYNWIGNHVGMWDDWDVYVFLLAKPLVFTMVVGEISPPNPWKFMEFVNANRLPVESYQHDLEFEHQQV